MARKNWNDNEVVNNQEELIDAPHQEDNFEFPNDLDNIQPLSEAPQEDTELGKKKGGRKTKKEKTETPVRELAQIGMFEEQVVTLHPTQLETRDDLNRRIDYGTDAEWKEFVGQIRANGIITPLKGYLNAETGKYVVVQGYRRNRAAQELLAEGVDVIVPFRIEKEGTTDVDRLLEQVTSNNGKKYNVYETALVVKALQDAKMKTADIATKLGVSQRYVQRLVKLVNAPERLIALIQDGTISATLAIDAANRDEAAMEALIERAATVRAELEEVGEGEGEGSGKQATVTKKNTEIAANPVNDLKQFLKTNDADNLHEDKQEFFTFLLRVFVDKDIKYQGIKQFFNRAAK